MVTLTSFPNVDSTFFNPSGAAIKQIATTSFAPRSINNLMAATSVPPVASIGSSTKTCRFLISPGILSA